MADTGRLDAYKYTVPAFTFPLDRLGSRVRPILHGTMASRRAAVAPATVAAHPTFGFYAARLVLLTAFMSFMPAVHDNSFPSNSQR